MMRIDRERTPHICTASGRLYGTPPAGTTGALI
jgi:hypothetical protein